MPVSTADRERLFSAARQAMARAYAPYSGFCVGAAVLTGSGAVYAGCNVENASYGLTTCAERVAIGTAVAAEGKPRILAVAVVSDPVAACPPCGACRQVIAEFGSDAVVLFQGPEGEKEMSLGELLPEGFRL